MNKQEVINKLEEYITVLKDDNTRLESVRVGNMPDYSGLHDEGQTLKTIRTGDNFDIDFDVVYLDKK